MKLGCMAALFCICMLAFCSCGPSETKPAEAGAAPAPASNLASQPATRLALAKELTLDLGNEVTMKLVLIAPGKFLMGSPDHEKDRFNNEGPQHEVTISKPFYVGVTHVTVDQFAAFVKDSGYETDAERDGWSMGIEIRDGKLAVKKVDGASWRNPSFDQKGNHPVVQVSWNDARAFCDWLSKKSGKTVLLPTEAQWEYACRAGTKMAYPWGDGPDDGKTWANCADQSNKGKLPNAPAECKFFSWDDGYVFTSPVGRFKANAFGLYDMIGNAWQWCRDLYGNYEKGAATDPTGGDTGSLRVLRGGAWSGNPWDCRSAFRGRGSPSQRFDNTGFRVAVLTASATLPSAQPATRVSTQLTDKHGGTGVASASAKPGSWQPLTASRPATSTLTKPTAGELAVMRARTMAILMRGNVSAWSDIDEVFKFARALDSAGETDEAITVSELALTVNPWDIQAHLNMARMYQAKGREDEAKSS